MKILAHVIRNINKFNIPAGYSSGYEISEYRIKFYLD